MNIEFNEEKLLHIARLLYLQCEMDIQGVADTVMVTTEVVKKWIDDGGWNSYKESLSISKSKQLKYVYKALNTLTSKLNETEAPAPKDVELMIKYSAIIKNLDTENDLNGLIHIAETFVRWLHKKNEPLAKTVTLELETYIKEQTAN